jgi:hypothetical protein
MDQWDIAAHVGSDPDGKPAQLLREYVQSNAVIFLKPLLGFLRQHDQITAEDVVRLLEQDPQYIFLEVQTEDTPAWIPLLATEGLASLLSRQKELPQELLNPTIRRADLPKYIAAMRSKDYDTALELADKARQALNPEKPQVRRPILPYNDSWKQRGISEKEYAALDPGYQLMLHAGDFRVPGFHGGAKGYQDLSGGKAGAAAPQPPKARVNAAIAKLRKAGKFSGEAA